MIFPTVPHFQAIPFGNRDLFNLGKFCRAVQHMGIIWAYLNSAFTWAHLLTFAFAWLFIFKFVWLRTFCYLCGRLLYKLLRSCQCRYGLIFQTHWVHLIFIFIFLFFCFIYFRLCFTNLWMIIIIIFFYRTLFCGWANLPFGIIDYNNILFCI